MQWIQFVLILMGQCSFFTCHLYEYHFIQEEKTWDEAQSYCREHYTDLATVSDMRDLERLTNSSQTTDAWIGLRSINERAIKEWHWSLPGEHPTECDPGCAPEWHTDEPNNAETGQQKYFFIDESKNWLQAQSYCREHHTDLVSGLEQINSDEFKERVEEFNDQDISNKFLWIGLFREIWSWSDGKNFSFRHWDPDSFEDVASKKCAMTTSNGKWSSDICTDQKPFYCYDVPDKVILIKEKKTWDEALDYCRENHRVLVSITDSHQQRWVEKRAKMADTEFVWLGMRYAYTLDLSFRVSDRSVCKPNLAPKKKTVRCDSDLAVAMKRDGKWYKKADSEKFNFICVK
ncbi:hypothetical protein NQZ68_028686 [Dissostichus eleginoides]|nr:hypothetical protein NQZ68_028686 [Dissostichus eleginoides]